MLGMPFTTAFATVCSEIMMTSEKKTNDTMQKTEGTTEDASECAPARACDSHAPNRTRKHAARKRLSKTKPFITPRRASPPADGSR